jgi:hypothetical protein
MLIKAKVRHLVLIIVDLKVVLLTNTCVVISILLGY